MTIVDRSDVRAFGQITILSELTGVMTLTAPLLNIPIANLS